MMSKRRKTYQQGSIQLEQRKRGTAVWVYRYLTTEQGRTVRKKVILGSILDLPTKADAIRASEHLRMAANVESARQPGYTMRGLVDRYVCEVLKPCLAVGVGETQDEIAAMSFHCAKSYQSNLNKYILPRWESYELAEFALPQTRAAVEQWLRSLLRCSKNPGGLAGKTVGHLHNTLKQVFKFGVKWGYLPSNPVSNQLVELPRGSKKRTKRAVQLSPRQFFALLTLYKDVELLAILFAGWLGPRVSEAFGLKWTDLDLVNGTVMFRTGFVQGRFTPLKTEASRTDLPLPDEVLEALRRWKQTSAFNAPSDWVFASPFSDGKRPYWPGQLMKRIQLVAVAAGFPKISWHSFRHSFSAWCKEAGLDLEQAKTLLRHEKQATTSEIYAGIEMESKRRIQQGVVRYVRERAEAARSSGVLVEAGSGKLLLPSSETCA